MSVWSPLASSTFPGTKLDGFGHASTHMSHTLSEPAWDNAYAIESLEGFFTELNVSSASISSSSSPIQNLREPTRASCSGSAGLLYGDCNELPYYQPSGLQVAANGTKIAWVPKKHSKPSRPRCGRPESERELHSPSECPPRTPFRGRGAANRGRGSVDGRNGRTSGGFDNKKGAYRRLWQKVTQVGRGQKLGDSPSNSFSEVTVEDLLTVVKTLPPDASAVQAINQGLYYLDSGALAALLKELAKGGFCKRANEIFDWIRNLSKSHDLSSLGDVFTYTTMIAQCGSHQQLRRALELVAEMRSRGIQCNVHTYSALMNVCIKANELDLALDVYKQMLAESCTPNLVTYNTLIDVYGKTGQWEEAVKVLDALESQGIEPEIRTYNTVIIACNMSGQAQEALKVYERMLSSGATPTATTYTALISAYGKNAQLDKALEIFQDMIHRNCERNVITYSSLISACEKAGRWELALELFNEMHREGCKPNVVTYNSLIAACAQGAQWEKASELFEQMQSRGCKPDSVTYGGLISAFEKGGQWRQAVTAFEHMKANNCRADSVVYNTTVGVLWKSGILWAQAKAVQLYQVACRQGHFRLMLHTNSESGAVEYSMHVFTVGAAVVSLLRWLSELKERALQEAHLAHSTVSLTINKGKPSREYAYPHIKQALTAILQGSRCCLRLYEVPNGCRLESNYSQVLDWLRSKDYENLVTSYGRLDCLPCLAKDVLFSEDSAAEARFSQVWASVRNFENMHSFGSQGMPQNYYIHRKQWVGVAFNFGAAFNFQEEVVHDGILLVDQTMAKGIQVSDRMISLVVASCLLVAAKHAKFLERMPSGALLEQILGYPLSAIDNMEATICQICNNDVACFSALRCVKIYLERLGVRVGDPQHVKAVAGDVVLLSHRLLVDPAPLDYAPSLVAAGLLTSARKNAGLVPFWPLGLEGLTGYGEEDHRVRCMLKCMDSVLNKVYGSPVSSLDLARVTGHA